MENVEVIDFFGFGCNDPEKLSSWGGLSFCFWNPFERPAVASHNQLLHGEIDNLIGWVCDESPP